MLSAGGRTLHAFVRLRAPDGSVHELVHGDLIGRVWSASLQINDARVSEAHAMVSLREGELQLIGLRGAFAVRGEGGARDNPEGWPAADGVDARRLKPVSEVALRAGLVIVLANGVSVEVLDVQLPEAVLGLEGPDLPAVLLPGVCSVLDGPLRVARGTDRDALATIWNDGERWWVSDAGEARPLHAGDEVRAGGRVLQAVSVPLGAAGPGATEARSWSQPLEIVVRYDTVHVHRAGQPPVALSGNQARLVSELVACGAPIDWLALARVLWCDEAPPAQLRARLDVVTSRIRRALRVQGVRTNLVRADGTGLVELLLYPDDVVKDES